MTVALPFEEGKPRSPPRRRLLGGLRERSGSPSEDVDRAEPANTELPLLFHLERGFGAPGAAPAAADESLVLLRSAGERGEAEAIAAEVARLLAAGAEPEEIAIVVRDPARRGPLLAAVLESYGIPAALEAEMPVGATAVGGA